MPGAAILGAQWGDEGKGKIVDLFAAQADLVVRFQGGPNAGHTVLIDTPDGPLQIILHHIPSGLLYENTRALMAAGMVVDPATLLKEIDKIKTAGFPLSPERLHLSWDAHVILPIHRAVDRAREESKKGGKIGTTLRGVGPTYEDRSARRGIRFRDLLDPDLLNEKLERLLFERNALLKAYGLEPTSLEEQLDAIEIWRDRVLPLCTESVPLLTAAFEKGQRVLFEGAQGALLDLSLGTYPYVTSSHTTSGGIFVGAGIAPQRIQRLLGVTKAYVTRVGKGPFPSELDDEAGRRIASIGREFGATTGRPRRCGWLDLVALRHTINLCGFTSLAVTKLDVLSGFEQVGLCRAYRTPDGRIDAFPTDPEVLADARPELEFLPGWQEPLSDCRQLADLPPSCRAYLDYVAEAVGRPIHVISVGALRDHSIVVSDPLWS